MAAGTMATVAGAAVLLYYMLSRRIKRGQFVAAEDEDDRARSEVVGGKRKMARRPDQAPATWLETLTALSETLRFTYSETLGKWPIGDLAFGINYLLRRQGNMDLASIYGGDGSVQLRGPAIVAELKEFVRLLPLCYYFSKKPFHVFLELSGYTLEDVLIHSPKAGILKPAFTALHDRNSKCLLLLIRGTHSMKDTLTAATGAVVPFHHSVFDDGGISNLVLGYAHCGMVAAARWIAKLITPCLVKALAEYPDHRIKAVGHSLGGGTASLLTYILREQKEFSSSTCVTFGSAACMTWELAESGKQFITSVINGSDLVPTFSSASADDLRSEVTASSWLNDLRDQVEHTRVLNVVYRSATALGSRLPSVASAKARVSGAGALLRPISSSTQVVIQQAQHVAQAVAKTRPSLSSWSCIGPRRRAVIQALNTKVEDLPDDSSTGRGSGAAIAESEMLDSDSVPIETEHHSCIGSHPADIEEEEEEEEEPLISDDRAIDSSTIEEVGRGALWYELENELQRDKDEVGIQAVEEEAAAAKEITEEERVLVISAGVMSTRDISESQRFYPPGRILHIVPMPALGRNDEEAYALLETPRELYSRLRLSKTMIHDHYMPVYKKRIELLITQLGQDEDGDDDSSVVF